MPEQIFKVTAQGDTIYIGAFCREDAEKVFKKYFGEVPASLMRWKIVAAAPKDEDVFR